MADEMEESNEQVRQAVNNIEQVVSKCIYKNHSDGLYRLKKAVLGNRRDLQEEVAVCPRTEEEDQMNGRKASLLLTHSRRISRLVVYHSDRMEIGLHATAKASLTCCTWQVRQGMEIHSCSRIPCHKVMTTRR